MSSCMILVSVCMSTPALAQLEHSLECLYVQSKVLGSHLFWKGVSVSAVVRTWRFLSTLTVAKMKVPARLFWSMAVVPSSTKQLEGRLPITTIFGSLTLVCHPSKLRHTSHQPMSRFLDGTAHTQQPFSKLPLLSLWKPHLFLTSVSHSSLEPSQADYFSVCVERSLSGTAILSRIDISRALCFSFSKQPLSERPVSLSFFSLSLSDLSLPLSLLNDSLSPSPCLSPSLETTSRSLQLYLLPSKRPHDQSKLFFSPQFPRRTPLVNSYHHSSSRRVCC